MSLDVYLTLPGLKMPPLGSGIFVREDGQKKEISREEWDAKFPDREPIVLTAEDDSDEVYSANITHNLNTMAGEAGIYKELWRPQELGITKASQLIEPLRKGLADLTERPDHFRKFNPPNGWGNYEGLVAFARNYLTACEDNPDADVRVWA